MKAFLSYARFYMQYITNGNNKFVIFCNSRKPHTIRNQLKEQTGKQIVSLILITISEIITQGYTSFTGSRCLLLYRVIFCLPRGS